MKSSNPWETSSSLLKCNNFDKISSLYNNKKNKKDFYSTQKELNSISKRVSLSFLTLEKKQELKKFNNLLSFSIDLDYNNIIQELKLFFNKINILISQSNFIAKSNTHSIELSYECFDLFYIILREFNNIKNNLANLLEFNNLNFSVINDLIKKLIIYFY